MTGVRDLERVARTRIFFGHQSVGANVLDGVPAVFAAHAMEPPPTVESRTGPPGPGGAIVHALIGENEKPLVKIADFDSIMRGGMAEQVDVAMMKLCYIDIRADTDVEELFTAYQDTLTALQQDYPDVSFVAVTVPLTTEPSLRTRIRGLITGSDRFGPAENARRERLNTMVRRAFADACRFDLAAAESTAPDGLRVRGSVEGDDYFSLHDGYASDLGHLTPEGSRQVAAAWLRSVALATSG